MLSIACKSLGHMLARLNMCQLGSLVIQALRKTIEENKTNPRLSLCCSRLDHLGIKQNAQDTSSLGSD